jgi:hypothetical protein
MTGFIVSVFPFQNRVSSKEAFEVLELGEGKLSRPVLRGPGGRKAAWLLGHMVFDRFHFSCNGVSQALGLLDCAKHYESVCKTEQTGLFLLPTLRAAAGCSPPITK